MKKRFQYIVLVICCGVILGSTLAAQEKLDADQVLQKMVEAYASEKEFHASGETGLLMSADDNTKDVPQEEILTKTATLKTQITFKTDFVRPNKFLFEWKNVAFDFDRSFVFWSDGNATYSWRPRNFDSPHFEWISERESSWMIGEATRGSMGTAQLLFSLLGGGKEPFAFNKMKDAQIVREEAVQGATCYVIVGSLSGGIWALWIDKQTFLLRRYRTVYLGGSFHDVVEGKKVRIAIGETSFSTARFKSSMTNFGFKPTLLEGDLDISKEIENGPLPPPPPPGRRPEKPPR